MGSGSPSPARPRMIRSHIRTASASASASSVRPSLAAMSATAALIDDRTAAAIATASSNGSSYRPSTSLHSASSIAPCTIAVARACCAGVDRSSSIAFVLRGGLANTTIAGWGRASSAAPEGAELRAHCGIRANAGGGRGTRPSCTGSSRSHAPSSEGRTSSFRRPAAPRAACPPRSIANRAA